MSDPHLFHLEYRAFDGRWINASCGPYKSADDAQAQIDKDDFMYRREDWRVRAHTGRYVYATVADQ